MTDPRPHVKPAPHKCEGCGYVFDMASNLTSKEPPRVGDLSVCLKCGNIGAFTEKGTVRELSVKELGELPLYIIHKLKRIESARRSISMEIDND